MSDDERIARLTELARRVLQDDEARVSAHRLGASVDTPSRTGGAQPEYWDERLSVPNHPRCLDALEAALLVLADGEWIGAVNAALSERHEAQTRRVHELESMVEQLAADWDARADRLERLEDSLTAMATGHEAARCAAELRARARQP